MTEEFNEFSELGTESPETVKEDSSIFETRRSTCTDPQSISPEVESNEKRIHRFLIEWNYIASPTYISHETGIKVSTVKGILSKLLIKGLISKPYHGLYCNYSPHGGGRGLVEGKGVFDDFGCFQNSENGVRFQNVDAVTTNVLSREVVSVDDVVFNVGDIRVVVIFGGKYNRVSWRLSCIRGVDYHCLMLVKLLVEERLRGLGYGDSYVWSYPQHEKLQDGLSVTESQDSLTVDSMEGILWKQYNKVGGVTRREVKVVRPVSAEALNAAYLGDVVGFRVADRLSAVENDLKGIHEALRVLNGGVSSLVALVKGGSKNA